jgi:mannan endo-1,4-beta-mannosidase
MKLKIISAAVAVALTLSVSGARAQTVTIPIAAQTIQPQPVPVPAQTISPPPVVVPATAVTPPPVSIPASLLTIPYALGANAAGCTLSGTPLTIACPPPAVTPPVPPAPPAAGALTTPAAVVSYLVSLETKGILAGQHTNYWDSVPTDDITGLVNQTGKTPAIIGLMANGGGDTTEQVGVATTYSAVALANQYLAAGSLVMVTEVPASPQNGSTMWGAGAFPSASMPAANFANVTTPGTAEYASFQAYLPKLAAALKQINGPVLFRPFAEQNGTWFWYGNQSPAQFIKMWQAEWSYLTNTAGLTNLVWVFATNKGMGNYAAYYPGAAYVDVLAEDAYPPSASDIDVWTAFAPLNKPEIYAESGATLSVTSVGANTLNNDTVLQTIEASFPGIVGVVVWCQGVALDNQLGAAAFMSDPKIVTAAGLPH